MSAPRVALIPGSFDPMTLGHVDLVRRAASLFDRVVVAVMVNGEKSGGGMFSPEVRLRIARASLASLPNVEVITDSGLLVDLAAHVGAAVLVKGVRGVSDFDYEYTMAQINRRLAPGAETLLLPADPAYDHISSSFAREMIRYHRPLDGVLHEDAIKELEQKK